MVKKIASALAVIVFLFGIISVQVHGQDATGSSLKPTRTSPVDALRNRTGQLLETKQEEIKEKVREEKENVRKQIEERRSKLQEKRDKLAKETKVRQEERKDKIAQKRAEKIREFASRMRERMLAMVERLEILSGRIQSRIDKLKEKGADTQEAQAQLDDAKSKLAAVKARISALSGVGADIAASDNPKEFFSAVKEEAAGIKKDLIEVHKLLASSLGKVKGLSSLETRERPATEGGTNEQTQ